MENQLSKNEKLNNIGFLLKLLASTVNEASLPAVPDNIDFQYIFEFAKLHKVANTVFYAVERLNQKPEAELYKKWEQIRNKNIHKNLIQTAEFSAVVKSFQENNITFMPFKGFDLCRLYPAEDYRSMSDLDILVRENQHKQAEKLLNSMGYFHSKRDTTQERSLSKPPFMIIELHRDLINIDSPHYDYYKNYLSRQNAEGYHKMSGEDFYIYNLAHLHKHFSISGCGVRNIMDLHLLNKKLLPQLDSFYIKRELEKLKLTQFSKDMSAIAEKWFEKQNFTDFSQTELYILSSSAYGTKENLKANEKKGKSKIAFVFSKLFPPLKWMQNFYPPLIKRPYLLPIFYIYRLISKPFR